MMANSNTFSPSQAEHFLQLAKEVLDTELPALKQKFITQLAEEGGLRKVAFFVEARYSENTSGFDSMTFWFHCVPFLRIITNDDMRTSLMLETAMGTIYNILYGHSGVRAIPFFTQVVNHLATTTSYSRSSAEFGNAVCVTVTALEMTLSVNQSAAVQKEFVDMVNTIRGIFPTSDSANHAARLADAQLRKVEQKLGMGEAIPERAEPVGRNRSAATDTDVYYSYKPAVDFPGNRSANGPRHDNDKESIVDIRILPTRGEIMSMMRTEYLPLRDYDPTVHHLPPGITRVLDTQFRLLREDTSGQLRDALRYLMDALAKNPEKPGRQPNGTPTILYRNVVLETFKPGDKEAVHLEVSFDQPQRLLKHAPDKAMSERKRFWGSNSKFLQIGSLVCLLDSEGGFTFFLVSERSAGDGRDMGAKGKGRANVVHQEQNPNSRPLDLVSHPTRALVALKLVDVVNDIKTVVKEYHRQLKLTPESQYRFPYLIEFPGILFASFEPILRFLQNMIATKSVPFIRFLAPEGNGPNDQPTPDPMKLTQMVVPPPLYLTKGNVTLDLSVIIKEGVRNYPLRHSIARPCSMQELQTYTTLDLGQCEALIGCLTRELALIQGPPGTGKSFLGVKLCQILLHNNSKLKLGPILCVCYTNHALDQFLCDLLDSGVEKIVRLGSRSREERLEKYSLRIVAQKAESTWVERNSIRALKDTIEEKQTEIKEVCDKLSKMHHWTTLRSFLEEKYPSVYNQLFGAQVDEEGFTLVSHRKPEEVVDDWVNMRYLQQPKVENATPRGRPRSLEDLTAVQDIRLLSAIERLRLKGYWESLIRRELIGTLQAAAKTFKDSQEELQKIYQERDRRCLNEAQVIGVTTTGLAGQAVLLRKVIAKVMVCEEAGEVLEAHTLTALLPSVEHAILIGDHQQLRPHIANYSLSMESRQGEDYKLDESLFERLTRERYGVDNNLDFPFATLDTQRRMHPSISNLIRQTLYPNLKDYESTHTHPGVEGMARRLFWMNHNHMEAGADKTEIVPSVSKSNDFEIDMVAALVKHLIKQGKYRKGEIAVLTPYLGQLMKMRKRFMNMFEILVGERDQEELDLMDDSDEEEQTESAAAVLSGKGKSKEEVRKGTLFSELRLATVDNFQGEEAKVIVISLVRCNPGRRCGFLKTSNRINVLLSRAKHGMYIIGNTDTARPVTMWSNVITLLNREGNLGDAFELRCPRHPEKEIFVKEPDDFLRFSPEGGCSERCGKRLEECGHTCTNKCHSDMLHRAVVCTEDCIRPLPGCDHPCPIPCGKKCLPCRQRIPEVHLPCGHVAFNVPCAEAQKPELLQCHRSVIKTVPGCGHTRNVACHVDVTTPKYKCRAVCNENLPCGHNCIAECHECRKPPAPRRDGSKHVKCRSVCERPFNTCGHSCSKVCHEGTNEGCGVCNKPCELRCSHSRCTKKCSEACTPCAEQCTWSCMHRSRCTMPCAVPCDILPCSKRCELPLRCGHQCPSLCGEKCPDVKFCRECATPEILETVVDMVCMETYKEIELDKNPIIVLACGHFFAMETVDGLMQMRDVYEYDAEDNIISQKPQGDWIQKIKPSQTRCPSCRGPLTEILRYNRVAKGITIEILTQKFLVTAHRQFLALEQQTTTFEQTLATARNTLIDNVAGLFADPRPGSTLDSFVSTRHKPFRQLQAKIRSYIHSVTKDEQPYGRIHTLVSDSIRRQRVADTTFVVDDTSVVLRNRLLGQVLWVRAHWALLYDLFEIHELNTLADKPAQQKQILTMIRKPLNNLKATCKQLEADALEAKQPRQQVEAKLYHARFVGLELKFPPPAPVKPTQEPLDPENAVQEGESTLQALQRLMAERQQKEREYKEKVESHEAEIRNKRKEESDSLDEAEEICKGAIGSTAGLLPQIEEVRKMVTIRDAVFYSPVTNEEQQAVYDAMRRELRGTGHWYYCENRHPFTVGECGMPMQTARCPQCDAPIGGRNHEPVAGVQAATDLETRFGAMRIR